MFPDAVIMGSDVVPAPLIKFTSGNWKFLLVLFDLIQCPLADRLEYPSQATGLKLLLIGTPPHISDRGKVGSQA